MRNWEKHREKYWIIKSQLCEEGKLQSHYFSKSFSPTRESAFPKTAVGHGYFVI